MSCTTENRLSIKAGRTQRIPLTVSGFDLTSMSIYALWESETGTNLDQGIGTGVVVLDAEAGQMAFDLADTAISDWPEDELVILHLSIFNSDNVLQGEGDISFWVTL